MPDDLKNRCHQCRKPNPTTDKELVERVREWVDKGEAWAQISMAQKYRDGKQGLKQSYVMAAMLFEKAVAQGDPDAMFDLACLYENGQGVVQSFEKASELYTMAVEQGHVGATYNLGMLYRDGQGVVQSFEKAVELWNIAVEQGDLNAMLNLGNMYRDGKGVVQSFKKTVELYTKAAEQGQLDAMNSLGLLYLKGQGVAQSNELAREWLTKAANEGEETAIKVLKLLDKLEGKPKTAPPTATAPPPSVCCSSCNKPQPSGHTFRKCTGCRTVQYCNKECQRAHWSPGGHKQECKRLRKKKEANKGSSSSQNQKSK